MRRGVLAANNMIITTTTTIEISESNAGLIPFIIAKNWGSVEWETPEESIIRLRNDVSFWWAFGQIAPHIETYFGEAWKEQSQAIIGLLNNWAISVNTTIDEN